LYKTDVCYSCIDCIKDFAYCDYDLCKVCYDCCSVSDKQLHSFQLCELSGGETHTLNVNTNHDKLDILGSWICFAVAKNEFGGTESYYFMNVNHDLTSFGWIFEYSVDENECSKTCIIGRDLETAEIDYRY